jgi:hypothetical protein
MFVCAAILAASCIPDFVSAFADSLFQCWFHVKHPLELSLGFIDQASFMIGKRAYPPFRFWADQGSSDVDARISRNINKVGTEQRGAALVGMNKRKLGRFRDSPPRLGAAPSIRT